MTKTLIIPDAVTFDERFDRDHFEAAFDGHKAAPYDIRQDLADIRAGEGVKGKDWRLALVVFAGVFVLSLTALIVF